MSIAAAAPILVAPSVPSPVAERLHRRTMRRLIGVFASLALAGALAAGITAAPAATALGTSSIASLTGTAGTAYAVIRRFTSLLTDAQRAVLAGPTGTGVRLGDLTGEQREAAMTMLRSLLSTDAWTVMQEAMVADDALAAAGSGGGSDDYIVGYLEDPLAEGAFLQFAGSQLAVNVLLRGADVIVEPELIDS